jgi:hypothetical protein
MEHTDIQDWLDLVGKILLRCFIFGYFFLLLWAGVYFGAKNLLLRVHGQLFGLTEHEMALIHYCGMVIVKVWVLLFFLIPYVAIRLVLRKQVLRT